MDNQRTSKATCEVQEKAQEQEKERQYLQRCEHMRMFSSFPEFTAKSTETHLKNTVATSLQKTTTQMYVTCGGNVAVHNHLLCSCSDCLL